MPHHPIKDALEKLSDLQSTLGTVQDAIPVLTDVLALLDEVAPLLVEVDRSMRESTSKIPRVASHLQHISTATELATCEILEIIEESLDCIDRHQHQLRSLSDDLRGREDVPVGRTVAHLDAEADEMEHVRASMGRIMEALQVQDITSQQIAVVNHIVGSIQSRMAPLIDKESEDAGSLSERTDEQSDIAADPEASYATPGTRQHEIDDVMQDVAAGDGSAESVDQGDIDALFGA